MKKRVLTGVKPTGKGMHLGNYLGAVKPFLEQIPGNESFLFIPDFHSLTSVHNGETMKENKHNLVCEILSFLPDGEDIFVFEQSKVENINNITWILSSVTPYSLMLKAHSFKDSQAKNSEINMATFNYPILMTSDIISYDVDVVPVGKDQIQHIEFARDIAQNFNKTYQTELFKLPNYVLNTEVESLVGIDGRKMSKSYNNFIGVFDDEKNIKKLIMSIATDDTPLESPKNPDTCNVFTLIKLLGEQNRVQNIRQKYLAGNYGYGHAKLELLEIFLEYFKKPREKFKYFKENYHLVEEKLKIGNKKANEIVNSKYNDIKNIIGL